jgi:hypothetical protein
VSNPSIKEIEFKTTVVPNPWFCVPWFQLNILHRDFHKKNPKGVFQEDFVHRIFNL